MNSVGHLHPCAECGTGEVCYLPECRNLEKISWMLCPKCYMGPIEFFDMAGRKVLDLDFKELKKEAQKGYRLGQMTPPRFTLIQGGKK